jgi:predicted RNase H-like nuclease
MAGPNRPGPQLPYRPIGGVVPCPGGWLALGGKLQGIVAAPEIPVVYPTLLEVLDRRPAFEIIVLGVPVGLLDERVKGGRACERAARQLLRHPRSAAIVPAPIRSAVGAGAAAEGLNPVQRALLPKVTEVAKEVQPYHQRTVYEGHPELSFHQLNGDTSLRWSKHSAAGAEERRALLDGKLPGIERQLLVAVKGAKPSHLLDAAALLWTARRVAARAVQRLPEHPEWDEAGLRMELVR